jgi:hypothetical protein
MRKVKISFNEQSVAVKIPLQRGRVTMTKGSQNRLAPMPSREERAMADALEAAHRETKAARATAR